MMTLDDLKQILLLVREHDVIEFELEQDGMKLRVRKDSIHAPVQSQAVVTPVIASVAPMVAPQVAPVAAPAPAATAPVAVEATGAADEDGVELAIMKSPIVGTFYRSPSPGASSFVEIGAVVRKGQVLCIIEAMKLMNEIESEYAGEIVKCYVENGQPVQYGERLFAIKASS